MDSKNTQDKELLLDATQAGSTCEVFTEITQIASELKRVIQEGEVGFLSIGERLIAINGTLEGLVGMIQRVQKLIGSGDQGLLSEYNEVARIVVLSIQQLHEKMDKATEALFRKNLEICSFSGGGNALDDIGRTLAIVALNIKVQSGRLDQGADAFFEFGKEIKSLSHDIREISAAIIADCTSLKEGQEKKTSRFREELKQVNHYLDEAGNDSEKLSAEMSARRKRLFPGFEKAGQDAVEIGKLVSSIVIAMQIHDMIRQKIEHVAEDLNRIAAGDMQLTKESFFLQSNQIDLVLEELTVARTTTEKGFVEILDSVESMLGAVNADEHGQGALFALLDASLSGLSDLLKNFGKARQLGNEMEEVFKSSMQTVKQLDKYATQTMEINESLEMKAINAIVMTGGLRKQSKPFRVLGEEVSNISQKSFQLIEGIRQQILVITDDGTDFNLLKLHEEQVVMEDQITRLSSFYDTLRTELEQSFAGTVLLKEDLMQAADSIRFISTLIEDIKVLKKKWDTLAGATVFGSGELDKESFQRYTMESERRVFRDVYGIDDEQAKDDNSVTLF